MRYGLVLLSGLMALLVVGCYRPAGSDDNGKSNSAAFSHDGRFGSMCHSRNGGKFKGWFCRVSIYQLYASPERFQGKTVQFTAYARQMGDELYLFPTEAAAQQLDCPSSILVVNPPPLPLERDRYTRANGVFDAREAPDTLTCYFGRLSEVTWP